MATDNTNHRPAKRGQGEDNATKRTAQEITKRNQERDNRETAVRETHSVRRERVAARPKRMTYYKAKERRRPQLKTSRIVVSDVVVVPNPYTTTTDP